jgi:hypothetical protein
MSRNESIFSSMTKNDLVKETLVVPKEKQSARKMYKIKVEHRTVNHSPLVNSPSASDNEK